jgi:hypothetical protein
MVVRLRRLLDGLSFKLLRVSMTVGRPRRAGGPRQYGRRRGQRAHASATRSRQPAAPLTRHTTALRPRPPRSGCRPPRPAGRVRGSAPPPSSFAGERGYLRPRLQASVTCDFMIFATPRRPSRLRAVRRSKRSWPRRLAPSLPRSVPARDERRCAALAGGTDRIGSTKGCVDAARARHDRRVGPLAPTRLALRCHRGEPGSALPGRVVVETMGLEPTTPCLQSRCSSQLSYVPGA